MAVQCQACYIPLPPHYRISEFNFSFLYENRLLFCVLLLLPLHQTFNIINYTRIDQHRHNILFHLFSKSEISNKSAGLLYSHNDLALSLSLGIWVCDRARFLIVGMAVCYFFLAAACFNLLYMYFLISYLLLSLRWTAIKIKSVNQGEAEYLIILWGPCCSQNLVVFMQMFADVSVLY